MPCDLVFGMHKGTGNGVTSCMSQKQGRVAFDGESFQVHFFVLSLQQAGLTMGSCKDDA